MAQQRDPNNLDDWFDKDAEMQAVNGNPNSVTRLGVIVGGSISKGLSVKLEDNVSVEELAVGRYVVVRGNQKRFF